MNGTTVMRGDVFTASLDPTETPKQAGTRPVVVVSRDAINRFSPVVVVVALTDAAHKRHVYPSHVPVSSGTGGLTRHSIVVCEQIRAISKTRLKRSLGRFDRSTMAKIEAALKITLDLS